MTSRGELLQMAGSAANAAVQVLPRGVEVVVMIADMRGAKPGQRVMEIPLECAASLPVDMTYQVVAGALQMPAFRQAAERMQAFSGGLQ